MMECFEIRQWQWWPNRVNVLKITEMYALKWWILCGIYYTLIKKYIALKRSQTLARWRNRLSTVGRALSQRGQGLSQLRQGRGLQSTHCRRGQPNGLPTQEVSPLWARPPARDRETGQGYQVHSPGGQSPNPRSCASSGVIPGLPAWELTGGLIKKSRPPAPPQTDWIRFLFLTSSLGNSFACSGLKSILS